MPETTLAEADSPLSRDQRELLDQVLDKWSLRVLETLCGRPLRFNELRREIPAVTQKSLTATLRRLERNGMVERVVTGTRPLAVEYRIAPLGKTLQDLVDALFGWTAANYAEVERARRRFDDEVTQASVKP
ncbi:helix-turn-helix domain-containing protein [Solwaraspora sp. WMMA2065]|uniref:winged helix-turn-helix transcriptional regulator n=1 Tax=Solwaraspora sp. WMMA2065 TaxID=3015166 RepID=UPI00259B0AA0|nr:helix-turn-helix domain-containing protein [Solwaraspora sp. WMMA2065]WJK32252.1 helix-turn-helix domain-containing protein [Solwaraspora sp. WMMA2065]